MREILTHHGSSEFLTDVVVSVLYCLLRVQTSFKNHSKSAQNGSQRVNIVRECNETRVRVIIINIVYSRVALIILVFVYKKLCEVWQ